jgi:lipopolysaccharide/colanic/teichoic acid biosynthesis glycosyltransferase
MRRVFLFHFLGGTRLLDHILADNARSQSTVSLEIHPRGGSSIFWASKRFFDISASLLLLLLLVPLAVVILILNPFLNRGKLLFVQKRMGRDCRPFYAIKFRSMTEVAQITRTCDDPIEQNRITRLGRFLRKTRIDELPQVLNVLKGEMSLIGPRPDYYEHASAFKAAIPGYHERHMIRPGITGLAQVDLGYIEGTDATRKKVGKDLYYIRNAGFRQEFRVFMATIATIVKMGGA